MQNIKRQIGKIGALLGILFLIMSCNDDFMERYPTTSVTPEVFFSNINDLKTYTDGFYGSLSAPIADIGTDNLAHHNSGSTIDEIMRGGVNPQNAAVWSWSTLRNINFFLENAGRVKGASATDVNHYIGIARFFRARFYMDKVNQYSDVPWYGQTMGTSDIELLHKKQDSRTLVVDSIMADLEFAAANIKADGHKSTVTKWGALAQLAQFALQEGTFRKYHTYLNLSGSANTFLQRAVSAAEEIMKSSKFSISTAGGVNRAYRDLFISLNLQSNPETILFIDYDKDLGRRRNAHTVLDYEWALSQTLMESYLMKDGKRFTAQAGYKTKNIDQVFVDRDPRLEQTFMKPGFQPVNASAPQRLKPTLGGYNQIKFYPEIADMISWEAAYTDAFVFRYAEILLIFAEAKAELGTLTSQADLDKSINLLRARVGMPAMQLGEANANVDPVLQAYYPNVKGGNVGLILEIRRERRVELACEGQRYRDVFRWEVGERLADQQQGMYVKALGAMDVTGDGKVDIAILESAKDTAPIKDLTEEEKKNISLYYLKDANGNNTSIYLENGNSGHIMFTVARDKKKTFEKPKYYYYPVANSQMVLDGSKLVQTNFW
ncbi:RagB/SusD family nutrient uptake outer membrane protein [Sphingobacterium sp. CZ-UAM]|uniref:RagB/SusD family nutrient uptake outer membrane protein n=1 Tax=Sphingobacterium sp. CZ-UAM TaxID=1933868 RepID=UPI0009869E1A|nr:RagB/SusD family nutrient uptake outer membrane protein [Sphingobacterium sp. CZ-UAM]OOG18376.1 RagB/SusD family nutrient uptake outer membrane protein [Sphingobacterium sp. CZ-UAM]